MTQQELIQGNRVRSWAMISRCGRYRYALTRIWDRKDGLVNWVMLNPSTADGREDDPTIRRVVRFTRDWGYGGAVVTNLYALRATDPAELARQEGPVGPENDAALVTFAACARLHVAAWGAHPAAHARARAARELLARHTLRCLGTTREGSPKHPLYLPTTTPLMELP